MHNLFVGVKRHPWKVAGSAIGTFGVLWTVIDAFVYFVPSANCRARGDSTEYNGVDQHGSEIAKSKAFEKR